MKISRRQLKNIILEALDASTVDAGEFPWPGDKPWWANSAVANGRWDADANIRYDLVEKHKELVANFADMAESSMPKGEVTPGKMEIEKERGGLFGLFKKKKKSGGQASKKVEMPPASSTAVGMYRKLNRKSQLSYGNQAMFANIADRYFIGMELKRFEDPQGMTFLRKLMGDIEFLVDFESANGGGGARKGIVLAALQEYYSGQKEVAVDFHKKVGGQSNTKVPKAKMTLGGVKGMEATGYIEGDLPEDTVYTLKGDTTYAYRKNEDAMGWEYALQKDLKAGKYNFKSIKGGSTKLNNALANNTLEANPMYTKKISDQGALSESLSRGSLYRNRYRRY